MTTHEIEVWVMVNESGEYEVGTERDACCEQFTENCTTGEPNRLVCLKLKVPVPTEQTVTGEVPPEDGGKITLAVA